MGDKRTKVSRCSIDPRRGSDARDRHLRRRVNKVARPHVPRNHVAERLARKQKEEKRIKWACNLGIEHTKRECERQAAASCQNNPPDEKALQRAYTRGWEACAARMEDRIANAQKEVRDSKNAQLVAEHDLREEQQQRRQAERRVIELRAQVDQLRAPRRRGLLF